VDNSLRLLFLNRDIINSSRGISTAVLITLNFYMIKKLSLVLIILAAFFVAGYALTVSAEEVAVTVSGQTNVNVDADDQDADDDEDMDNDGRDEDADDSDENEGDENANEDRGGWWGSPDVREERDELRNNRPSWFDFFRARKAEFRAQIEIREDMKQNRRGLIEARWNMLSVRFENVIARLESRIDKMDDAGMDVSAAVTHVANAKASIRAAQSKAARLAAAAEDKVLTKEAVMEAKVAIKADLETAKTELKLAIQVLVALQAESESDEDSDEDENE